MSAADSLRSFGDQIVMRLCDLSRLPPFECAEGYSIQTYRLGDEAGWESIIAESVGHDMILNYFSATMKQDPAFQPERVFFAAHGQDLVATASAWEQPQYAQNIGWLHMVGCRPSHAGKHLGRMVSLAALHHMVKEGRTVAMLRTDDFRLSAIHTYLSLGFEPVIVADSHRARWRSILTKLGTLTLIEGFRPILNGSVLVLPRRRSSWQSCGTGYEKEPLSERWIGREADASLVP